MTDAHPQRARPRTSHSADHHLVVRVTPGQQTHMGRLADALLLHAEQTRAHAAGSPMPHLARVQKLGHRRSASEEGEDE